MRILVESLKRLYENDRVTKVQLQKRVEKVSSQLMNITTLSERMCCN